MVSRQLTPLLACVLLVACNEHITDTRARNPQSVSVLTQHNDNTRAGWNDHETLLTTGNVDVQHFGRQFSLAVDDEVYAQPLVVGSVAGIGNGERNVVYIATVANTVYAFDGDDGRLYWQQNFTAAGMRPPRNTDMTGACNGHYLNFSGNMGIVGTPVIDDARGVMYFVARSTNGTQYAQYLHAVHIAGGDEIAGSPVLIAASVGGSGDGSHSGFVAFEPQKANQRQALTLVNGTVYVSFSSHCDWGPYHGWILGYDATTLQRDIVYNDTPDGYAGGMWESGMGMAADFQGNLYVTTGNGTVGVGADAADLRNRSESALKLTPSGSALLVSSFFTPANYQFLNDNDLDYGVMGSLLIPASSYYFTAAKDGTLFLLDRDNMGGVSTSDQAQQVIPLGIQANLHAQPAYYKGSAKEFVYVWSEGDPLRAFPFDRGSNRLDVQHQVDMTSGGGPGGQSGAVLSVSSNGTEDGTGILWASYAFSGDAESFVTQGILRAFDANDVTHELWNNHQNLSRDGAGMYAKFSSPTIANGHVYLPTFSHQVVVYGLLP